MPPPLLGSCLGGSRPQATGLASAGLAALPLAVRLQGVSSGHSLARLQSLLQHLRHFLLRNRLFAGSLATASQFDGDKLMSSLLHLLVEFHNFL